MTEFLTLLPPAEALQLLIQNLPGPLEPETIPTADAIGRVLSSDITSPTALPTFPRSTMDGYAVRAQDTYGATQSLPAYLQIVGEIHMGSSTDIVLSNGQAALIHTGGMLPQKSDAVVMVENTQPSNDNEIEVLQASAVGENVLNIGEDVTRGAEVLRAGSSLRPQDIGALMAIGITDIRTVRRPTVTLISTGDEVVRPELHPRVGQVRDINSYTLSSLVLGAGGQPKRWGIVADDYVTLKNTAVKALRDTDVLVIAAGSSASVRDITGQILDELGEPGVILHGVAIKPGKPTILAVADKKPAFGLPGNPVSAMMVARVLLLPTLHFLQDYRPKDKPKITAQLTQNVASIAGREDYVPVRIHNKDGSILAEPVFGKSNLIFTLVQSDGTITVPLNSTGLLRGEMLQVDMY